ncbi:class I mannose-6-phosphate isomerase [Rhizobium panacihumi]|uniref:class I mannose-6-phosphate isomerase n=1 Tax=Rhizobium panacihumi TaxID=2008450 RepID=UPI003D79B93D
MFEYASVRTASKPWGSRDLMPWSEAGVGAVIGELLYERSGPISQPPALLLKLLFTKQILSIQVHPDDAFAKAAGMKNGKTEAWYVLSADEGAQVAIGLNRSVAPHELRAAIEDGSIQELLDWQSACAGDVFFIPAGTIHTIGAGLVIAEIQQRSDTTFRLFDRGSDRKLHIEEAMVVADLQTARPQGKSRAITPERTLLTSCDFFVLERMRLAPGAIWEMRTDKECWVLVIAGDATVGSMTAKRGDAFFSDEGRTSFSVGDNELVVLLAYTGDTGDVGMMRDLGSQLSRCNAGDRQQTDVTQSKPVASTSRSTQEMS